MPEYLSPGVYVEEVPSAVQPIAGVSTSTAAFIGIVPDTIQIPAENPAYDPKSAVAPANSPFITWTFPFPTAAPDDAHSPAAADFTNFTNAQTAVADPALASNPADTGTQASEKARKLRVAQKTLARYTAYQAAGPGVATNVPVLCTSFSDFKIGRAHV